MFINTLTKYDGFLLHHRFAYKFFQETCSPLGNIIGFRGPMEVLAEGMLDQEDIRNGEFIWSDDAIHFLWELPILGNHPFGAVAYQRLLNTQIAAILATKPLLNMPVTMKGDDIMVAFEQDGSLKQGKCSVSITHVKDFAALGHTGINIRAGKKAPAHAYSTELGDDQIHLLVERVFAMFEELNREMFIASNKVV